MFETVLVAAQGQPAVRVIETCRRLDLKAVTIYSEPDAGSLHVRMSDEAVPIGGTDSYADVAKLLEVVHLTGADAVHPGSGALALDPAAARAIGAHASWVGPSAYVLERSRAGGALAAAAGLAPEGPAAQKPAGDDPAANDPPANDAAANDRAGNDRAGNRSARNHSGRGLHRRMVEVQILGLADGRMIDLGTRDTSLHDAGGALVAEAPAPLPEATRRLLSRAARAIAEELDCRGLATVRFGLDPDGADPRYHSVDPRLTFPHPATELVTGIDLVEQQLLVAAGDPPSFDPDEIAAAQGHALVARVAARDPHDLHPTSGTVRSYRAPDLEGVRVDAGYVRGDTVAVGSGPDLAAVCAWAPERSSAVQRLRAGLGALDFEGPATTAPLLERLLDDDAVRSGRYGRGTMAGLIA